MPSVPFCRILAGLLLLCAALGPLAAQRPQRPARQAYPQHHALAAQADWRFEPPPSPLRAMAEWEEVAYLALVWMHYPEVMGEIVRAARRECQVLIVCADSIAVQRYLEARGIGSEGLLFLQTQVNSVWIRDYGPQSAYLGGVDSLMLVDWIYNRPRPFDDQFPALLAARLGLPLVSMTRPPHDLVHTGGNFLTDGLGTAFSSDLLLGDNREESRFNARPKPQAEIEALLRRFLGIRQLVLMPALPYDIIHHVDMHMKLLDEGTLLVGSYPSGRADGPQIEANLRQLLSETRTAFGRPWRVLRIPMPDDEGRYPGQEGAAYLTYTNLVFLNRSVLVPVYGHAQDSLALSLLRAALPGYRLLPLDCGEIIRSGGALHCMTQTIGVADPLWIAHQPPAQAFARDGDCRIEAYIQHRSGIREAWVHFSTDSAGGFQRVPMRLADPAAGRWEGWIPELKAGQKVRYFIHAEAISGKRMIRPLVAPEGAWAFPVLRSRGQALPR